MARSLYSRTLSVVMEPDGPHCKVCRVRLSLKPLGCLHCQAGTTALALAILEVENGGVTLSTFRRQVLALVTPQSPRMKL